MKYVIKQQNLRLLSEEDNVNVNVQNNNYSDNNKIVNFEMNGLSNSKHNCRQTYLYFQLV